MYYKGYRLILPPVLDLLQLNTRNFRRHFIWNRTLNSPH